eukprot:6198427-Pleurochrysis_carterae.AAC.1
MLGSGRFAKSGFTLKRCARPIIFCLKRTSSACASRGSVGVRECSCVRVGARARVGGWVRACVRASVRTCLRASAPTCARASQRARERTRTSLLDPERVRVRVRSFGYISSSVRVIARPYREQVFGSAPHVLSLMCTCCTSLRPLRHNSASSRRGFLGQNMDYPIELILSFECGSSMVNRCLEQAFSFPDGDEACTE